MKNTSNHFDVIIIGGSYSGLSAAMALGRSLRKVLILDSGTPCNAQTPHSHNFLTQDGKKPSEIASIALEQVLKYDTVFFEKQKAIEATKTEKGFEISTESEIFFAKKLILATGIRDILPEIKGLKECWGISVIHCPYCHGYEFRHQKTGIMANGERAYHLAGLIKNLTDDVTIFTNGKAEFTDEQFAKLSQNNIHVIEEHILEIVHIQGKLSEIVMDDETSYPLIVLYASLAFEQHTNILEQLECDRTETGHIKIDTFQKISVEGVFACGDNSSPMRSVANAVFTGNVAGAMVNYDLTVENF
ncbi:NAD(P)/FAD-dependent oxidoreductase [Chryseobacterium gambrini]|uniref:NAD(P)/FAD-dependent oxidoreductase n=1 Tax=Chryseobacterium gambrini TaxID=373672 RepID=UPI0022F3C6D5|nr:NAD(P)/FAD-dependent oxidoreductase [Chryseobacterium gambrini]WBX98020.1 NAD(P)/FAD-dependent oxidoreductase [Chryseobacterium gambrini]